MRTLLLSIYIFAIAIIQLTLPVAILPGWIVPDLVLLVTIAIALSDEPSGHLPWLALLAGLSLDIWLPGTFGAWMIAALVVLYVTLGIKARRLSKLKFTSVLITSVLAIVIGLVVIGIAESLSGPFTVAGGLYSLVRIYLPKILFDAILAWPVFLITRSVVTGLRGRGTGNLLEDRYA